MAEYTASRVVGATLIGGIAGATLALLFAPRSGEETREHIKESMQKAKSEAAQQVDKAKSKLRTGMETAKDFKGRVRDAAHETKEEMKTASASRRRGGSSLTAWDEEV